MDWPRIVQRSWVPEDEVWIAGPRGQVVKIVNIGKGGDVIYAHDNEGNSLELRFGPKGMEVIVHGKDGHSVHFTATPDTTRLFLYDVNTKGSAAMREFGEDWRFPWLRKTTEGEPQSDETPLLILPPTSPESPS